MTCRGTSFSAGIFHLKSTSLNNLYWFVSFFFMAMHASHSGHKEGDVEATILVLEP